MAAKSSKAELPAAGPMLSRCLYALTNILGRKVEVQVKDGSWYTGVLHSANPEKGYATVLRLARSSASKEPSHVHHEKILINGKDIVQIAAKGVVYEETTELSGFKTDKDISGGMGPRVRELERWRPEESDASTADLLLEQTYSKRGGGWDQFAENKRLFGVTSTYSEEMYTTKLDRTDPMFAEREKEATRLAREIATRETVNPHLAEERGHKVEDDYMDEEDRFSTVVRDAKKKGIGNGNIAGEGKYVPPQKRDSEPLVTDSECVAPILQESLRVRKALKEISFGSRPATVKSLDMSPFSQARRGSPLVSPLVGDPLRLNALALEPGSPRFPEEAVEAFAKFTLELEEKKSRKQRTAAIQSFRSFSFELETRMSPRVARSKTISGASALKTVESNFKKIAPSQPHSTHPRPQQTQSQPLPQVSTNQSSSDATPPPSSAPTTSKETKKPSKLNPNAAEFKPRSFAPSAQPGEDGPQRPVWQSSPVPYQDVMYGNQQLRVPTGSVPDPSAGVPGAFVTYLPPEEQIMYGQTLRPPYVQQPPYLPTYGQQITSDGQVVYFNPYGPPPVQMQHMAYAQQFPNQYGQHQHHLIQPGQQPQTDQGHGIPQHQQEQPQQTPSQPTYADALQASMPSTEKKATE